MSLMGYCVSDASSRIHELLLCGMRAKRAYFTHARCTAYLSVHPDAFE
jgi:hypothetical protein